MPKLLLIHMTSDCQKAELECLCKAANDSQYVPVVVSCGTTKKELDAALTGQQDFDAVYICAHGCDSGITSCVSTCPGIYWETLGTSLCQHGVVSNSGVLILGCCTGSAGITAASILLKGACHSLKDVWGPCTTITSEQTCIALAAILSKAGDSSDTVSQALTLQRICMRKAA
jgi:hypothetical protein